MAGAGEAGFKWRVRLSTLRLRRTDDQEEDDFKTWALTTVATTAGPAAALWYPCLDGTPAAATDANANLGKTSVRARVVRGAVWRAGAARWGGGAGVANTPQL